MCLRYAAYDYEQRIKQLEDANDELKQIATQLWLNQFAPLPKRDKAKITKLMRKHGIEVFP